ncbi:MAG: isopentenyl-diphosphate Delta-isomerase [Chitinophagia bacterium]|nr:isopentenyl-diphosphate Delta-isomerase [Chitinophagia bacterium]
MEQVILVDVDDCEIGVMEKMEAHKQAVLHRAFSVFLFNPQGKMLLQQRALTKYHSAGLWTNTCCSHPRPGETLDDAVTRRLMEEMGITAKVSKAFDFIYQAELPDHLNEHEFDHVFIGNYDDEVRPNHLEVANFVYQSIEEVAANLQSHPEKYTVWFKIAFPKVVEWYQSNSSLS